MIVTETPKQPLYLADLITGVMAALAKTGVVRLSARNNRIDRAFARLYGDLTEYADREKLSPRFRISLHPIHGVSEDVQQEIAAAAKRDLISLQNPEYTEIHIKISTEEAGLFLKHLPGSPTFYERLADLFLKLYKRD